MDDRIVQFISGLRAAGVRVSLAESQDAAFATGHIGIADHAPFQVALRATLIKEHSDEAIFDALFPLYFGHGAPPMLPATETLSEEQQALLREALRALAGELSELLRRMLEGEGPSEEQMEAAATTYDAIYVSPPAICSDLYVDAVAASTAAPTSGAAADPTDALLLQ